MNSRVRSPWHRPAIVLGLGFGLGLAQAADTAADALAELRLEQPAVQVASGGPLGTTRQVACARGPLATADGSGAVDAKALARVRGDDPHRLVRAFVARYAALFGDAALLDHSAVLASDHTDPANGLRSIAWTQEIDGIPVQGARFVAHLARDGSLIDVQNAFVPHASDLVSPASGAAAAVDAATAARTALGGPVAALAAPDAGARRSQGFSTDGVIGGADARLAWALRGAELRLAWEVTAHERATDEVIRTTVDAQDGTVLGKRSLTTWFAPHASAAAAKGSATSASAASSASGSSATPALPPIARASTQAMSVLVYDQESPQPMLPGLSSNSGAQPAIVPRVTVAGPGSTTTDPDNWLEDGVTVTMGNNVDAHPDLNANDINDEARPSSATRAFAPAIDLTQNPSAYTAASVVNAFYRCNFMHDRLYAYGFDEASGNFQVANFGRGGFANDAVQCDAQDGSGTNNANFSCDADGGSTPRMQMYTFTFTTPNRDGSLDATVVCHEYTHGLSTRLVGGGGALGALQSGGMGEGWSDFYALALLTPAGADPNANYPLGAYVTGNYYNGIRRYPYATSTAVNPLTWSDIAAHPEVHQQGEVWCNTLWQARANFIAAYGDPAGNDRLLRLVTDGMKLTPPNPGFLDARDGILHADQVDFGGADAGLLWRAFAKRGMGPAAEGGPAIGTQLVENIETIGALLVVGSGYYTGGAPGGFSGQSKVYTLDNLSGAPLAFTAASDQPWVACSPASGTIPAGGSIAVAAQLGAAADALPLGDYDATLTFTDTTNGGSFVRAAKLDVVGRYLAEVTTYAWLSPSSPQTASFPITNGPDADDALSNPVTLPFAFSFYGQSRTSLAIGSNDLVTFGAATPDVASDSWFNTALGDPFPLNATICPLWFDLYPPQAGASVTYGTVGSAPDRTFVVTWNAVPWVQALGQPLTFQLQLHEGSDDIDFMYQELQPGAAAFGGGKLATVGVEDARGIVDTQWQAPGSVSLANASGLRFSYSAAAPPTPPAAAVKEGGSPRCGVGFGLPGLVLGCLWLRRRRSSAIG